MLEMSKKAQTWTNMDGKANYSTKPLFLVKSSSIVIGLKALPLYLAVM